MKSYVRDLELLSRTNLHDRLAGALGILPNHLIHLLRLTNNGFCTQIINDLRFTTFWSTYRIWTKRHTLYRTYWKMSAANQRKRKNRKRKNRKRKGNDATKSDTFEQYQNPFPTFRWDWKYNPFKALAIASFEWVTPWKKELLDQALNQFICYLTQRKQLMKTNLARIPVD